MILKIGDSVPLKRQFFCSWKRVGDSSNLSLRVRVNESTIELESKKGRELCSYKSETGCDFCCGRVEIYDDFLYLPVKLLLQFSIQLCPSWETVL